MSKFNLHAFADEAGQELSEQIAALRDNGYEGMEIRKVSEKNVSQLTIEEAKEINKRMKDAGLCVWSIGSPIGKIKMDEDFEEHMDLYKHVLELSAVFDAKAIRLFSFHMEENETEKYRNEVIERMGRIVDVAKPYNIKICHENEKGIYGDDAARCLDLYKSVPGLGGIFDPANFVQCKQDTLEAWDILKSYITYMHIKDADDNGIVVPPGEGIGNISALLKKYYAQGGRDLTLEPHLKAASVIKDLEHDFDATKFQIEKYATEREAFDFAVNALNNLIKEV